MKRKTIVIICYILGALLLVMFAIKTVVEWYAYNTALTSAPFYLAIIANALFFVLPSLIAFVVGVVINKKSKK